MFTDMCVSERSSPLFSLQTVIGEALVTEIGPIREKTATLLADKTQLEAVLAMGASYANDKASNTMDRVRTAMGMVAAQK